VKRTSKTALIVPVYNEEKVITKVLRDLQSKAQSNNYLIIVIDDGSTDKTLERVQSLKKIVILRHLINRGQGAAVRTGLTYARRVGCNYAVTMDSDGQHDTMDVLKLAKLIQNSEYDMIVGSRLIDSKGMPWYRIAGNKFLGTITFLLFGVNVSDSQSGMRALNASALDTLHFSSNRYAFCSEMIWQAKRAGLKTGEAPIKAIYTDYSLKKGQRNIDALPILRQLLKRRFMDLINE